MDQKLKSTNSQPGQRDALKWACEVLGLDEKDQAIQKKETRRHAINSFFNSLNSSDFHPDSDAADAVEVILGKPPHLVPAFLRYQRKQLLERLDHVVEWYSSQLGEKNNDQLIVQLGQRLSGFDAQSIPADVQDYAKRIWMAARTVEPPTNERNLAAKRIVQALFHLSTIRSTKRCLVRSKQVETLQEQFSVDELTEARNVITQEYKTPNDSFHRPFLFLLTFDDDEVEEYRIGQPVNSALNTIAYSKNFGSKRPAGTRKEQETNWGLLVLVVVGAFVGLAVNLTTSANKSTPSRARNPVRNPKPAINFDLDLEIPAGEEGSVEKTLEVLAILHSRDPEERKRWLEEARQTTAKAREATKRLKAKEAREAREERNKRNAENQKSGFGSGPASSSDPTGIEFFDQYSTEPASKYKTPEKIQGEKKAKAAQTLERLKRTQDPKPKSTSTPTSKPTSAPQLQPNQKQKQKQNQKPKSEARLQSTPQPSGPSRTSSTSSFEGEVNKDSGRSDRQKSPTVGVPAINTVAEIMRQQKETRDAFERDLRSSMPGAPVLDDFDRRAREALQRQREMSEALIRDMYRPRGTRKMESAEDELERAMERARKSIQQMQRPRPSLRQPYQSPFDRLRKRPGEAGF